MHRVVVANRIHRPGQQPGGFARQVENAGLFEVTLVIFLQVADAVVGRGRQVHQHDHRQIAQVPRNTDIYPRIGHDAAPDIDHRTHRGIDIELVSILVTSLAHDALRLQRVDQVPDAARDRFVFFENLVHQRRILAPLAALDHGGPFRPRQLYLVIPLVVVKRLGHGLDAFRFIVTDAVVLVGKQLGRQHPDFLRAAVLELGVDLVDHLHDVDVLALRRLTPRQPLIRVCIGAGFVEIPEIPVIVAVRHR